MTLPLSSEPSALAAQEWPAGQSLAALPVAPVISVVITIHNQRTMLAARYHELIDALGDTPFEIIAVDDGSIDGSFGELRSLAASDPRLHLIRLRRSFGRSAALSAGFERARGDLIVSTDASVQLGAGDIATLRAAIAKGADLVNGARTNTTPQARAGSRMIGRVTGIPLADYGSPLKAYRAPVARELHLYGDLYRFIPALANWQGARLSEVQVQAQSNEGVASPGPFRSLGLLLDMITMRFMRGYAHRPMQSIGRVGVLLMAISLVLLGYLGVVKFGFGIPIGNRPLLQFAVLLTAISVQLLVLGLLAELMIRVYYEVQNKPIYTIREILNDTPAEPTEQPTQTRL